MKTMTKRAFSLIMAFALSVSILVGVKIPAKAATVDYVYSGKYIYNWGTRETVATFLSPNAVKFYQDNNTSFQQLASLSGNANTSSTPSSALYKELQKLMKDNHSKLTSYGETRYIYQYTDCQNSGKTSKKISSFYSGKEIGPDWDGGSTWNREHTWPKSKTDYKSVNNNSINEATDIMSLRPTASSENSSRSNDAYGTVSNSNYFNPNHFANGKYDLRGDVARITLYVYTRWGNTNKMWGSSGVIESKEVLLKWMKEDPVDTWELGRNDSVEAITGTRNVFVDYPELAFCLFEEAIPANYQSPSKSTQTSTYKITATSGNSTYGKVSVSGSIVTATPEKGYEVSGYKITKGTATVTQSGDSFIVNASSDVSITINFAKSTCKHTNTTDIPGAPASCDITGYTDGVMCLDCNKYISGHAEIAPTGHKYTDSKDTTCNVCGYVKDSATTSKPAESTATSKPSTTSKPTTSKPQVDSNISNDTTSSGINSDVLIENETTSSLPDGNIDNTPDEIPNITPDGIPNIITDNGKKDSFPWWIIIVAVVAIGGGIVAVVIILKKKKKIQ